jgi:putative photosynthetic complex assembly protein
VTAVSDMTERESVPRLGLLGLGALVLVALLATIAGRLHDYQAVQPPDSQVLNSRSLRFEDAGGGLVQVYDAELDELVLVIPAGEENFIRGVLRGLARERRSLDIDLAQPFLVSRHDDGRLTLEDSATGRSIELGAFGTTNVAAFARLLEPGAASEAAEP